MIQRVHSIYTVNGVFGRASKAVLVALQTGRQQVKRHGENQVHHQDQTTNHAERPLLVTSDPVIVAMRIMTTAPGQNCRLIAAGPIT